MWLQKETNIEKDEKEEVTGSHGMPPFIDMGVWGPCGDCLAPVMKFTSQAWKDGQWKAVEI